MTAAATAHGRTSHDQSWRWSRADYYRLGDLGFFAGKRVELLRGEIVESPSSSRTCCRNAVPAPGRSAAPLETDSHLAVSST